MGGETNGDACNGGKAAVAVVEATANGRFASGWSRKRMAMMWGRADHSVPVARCLVDEVLLHLQIREEAPEGRAGSSRMTSNRTQMAK